MEKGYKEIPDIEFRPLQVPGTCTYADTHPHMCVYTQIKRHVKLYTIILHYLSDIENLEMNKIYKVQN